MATLTFDIPSELVIVELPDVELTIQELWDKTMEFLATHEAMSVPNFMFGSGKTDLGGGDFVGITITMVDWKVQFADQPGPGTIVTTIRGGNLVGRVGTLEGAVQHPVEASAFTFNIINQSTSPALIAAPIPDESFLEVSYIEGSTSIRMGAWLERAGAVVTSGLVDATITWYNPDGSVLFTVNDTGPDAQGHFEINVTQILATNTAYYATVAVQDAKGAVTTRRGVPTTS